MRQPILFSGVIYLALGVLFTFFAIENVQEDGWNFFSYLLVILATLDFGNGIRKIQFHFYYKRKLKEKNNKSS
ncbi:hypothetical protein Q73_15730 [Bacillus coahuilensis m2-6]|uniref:Lipoprotein n=1 Tax=Bacillus coahuilensis p1.1.43 TaxID=1150625 RepID=A0A147K585_9BACI|nr:YdiK family protein [Bacillus coahuilensis]KUP04329.1 hypothetical protein Q73_15730 [Bacillus coahuilensis m2-6]KUP04728.1 hypothetical protein Q75_14885 [Bacillus coahuilensis p1.1.43]